MSDDDTWEARMAARARERAQKRAEEEAEAVKLKHPPPAWLNGNHQVSGDGTTVWIFPSQCCICCGTPQGSCCFAYPPDYVAPPDPDWPFSYENCPLCQTGRSEWSDTFDRNSTTALGADYS